MHVHNYIRDCSISMTQACNLHCQYCFRDSGIDDIREELSFAEWKEVFQKLKDSHVIRVLLTGGEPLIRTDIYQIIEELLKLHIQVSIATNGTICNKNVFDLLGLYNGAVGFVQVSLDGDCPEINDKTRGSGSFDKTVRTVNELQKRGVKVSCRVTLSKYNVEYFRRIYDFIYSKLKIHNITINEIQQVGRGLNTENLLLASEDRIKLITSNRDIIEKLHFMNCEISKLIRLAMGGKSIAGGKLQACMRSFKGIHILQNGDVVPCDMLPDVRMGNILEMEDLQLFWKKNDILVQFRKRININLSEFSKCKDCRFEDMCTGSCPVYDYQSSGWIMSNDEKRCFKYIDKEYSEFLGEWSLTEIS